MSDGTGKPDVPLDIAEPNVVVVEGKEDELFFEALIEHLGLQRVQIMGIGGKTKLRKRLALLRTRPRFSELVSLSVVRDANTDPCAAFQSVRDALQNASFPVPTRPFVPSGRSPEITVIILPDGNTPGMLEDLCLKALTSDPSMVCVEQYFQCLRQQGCPGPSPHHVSKAKIQTLLASKHEPGKRLGEAAQAGYWPWDQAAFQQLTSFFQRISSQRNSS